MARTRATLVACAVLLALPVAAASSLRVDDVAGLYVRRHNISVLSKEWEPSAVEDVMEIVKVAPDRAYVRARLSFHNGHLCSFYGVAKVEGQSLVYARAGTVFRHVDGQKGLQKRDGLCRLGLTPVDGKMVFSDQGNLCNQILNCGARGSWDGAAFDLKSRRPIRYMSRLLASREYAAAMKEAGR